MNKKEEDLSQNAGEIFYGEARRKEQQEKELRNSLLQELDGHLSQGQILYADNKDLLKIKKDLELQRQNKNSIDEPNKQVLEGRIEKNKKSQGKITGVEPPITYKDAYWAIYGNNEKNTQTRPAPPKQPEKGFMQNLYDRLRQLNPVGKRKQEEALQNIEQMKKSLEERWQEQKPSPFNPNERQVLPPLGEWAKPVDNMRITSPYSKRIDPVTKQPGRNHQGIDIGVPMGTPIYASHKGIVEDARFNNGYGMTVLINHGQDENKINHKTRNAHMSKTDVKKGDIVERGQEIGKSGSTGKSTGPHLHYEYILFDNEKKKANPKYRGDFDDPLKHLKKQFTYYLSHG